jgi:RHS repeat-associated protein
MRAIHPNTTVTNYPFGMLINERAYSSYSYRFGFNGMQKDDEVSGSGNNLDFGARIYDSRLGRWMSLDPLMIKYPSLTPFNFVNNSPIIQMDIDGRDFIMSTFFKKSGHGQCVLLLIATNDAFIEATKKLAGKDNRVVFEINEDAVSTGADATTRAKMNAKVDKFTVGENDEITYEVLKFNSLNTISFRQNSSGSTMRDALLVIHEVLHAVSFANGEGKGSDDEHKVWDKYIVEMTNIVRELYEDAGIKLDESQVYELSIWNAGEGADIFDKYIVKRSKEDGVSIDEAKKSYYERIEKLTETDLDE